MTTFIPPQRAEPPLILTLDMGSSSTRAMLFDRQARPIEGVQAQVGHRLRTTSDGGAEFNPAELLNGATQVIDAVLQQAGSLAGQIQGVATATFVTNILGLDAAGRPVTPVFTYADTRSNPDVAQLQAELDMAAVHDRTGCRIHSTYLPAQFRWLARTQPELLPKVRYWLSMGEYLLWEFLGARQASYAVASWTGLLNRRALAWDADWLAQLPLEASQLSPLVDIDQPAQGLRPKWANRWPALKDVPWFPALGDGAAANVGSGCLGPERLALTIGTTGAMRVALEQPVETVPDGLWLYRVNRHYTLLGGATSEGGNIFAWLNQILQLPADTEAALAQLPPAGHGLSMLPFIAGERAPGWRGQARAAISGLSLHTRPIEILQAGLEAVAFRFELIHRRLSPHLPPEHQIVASGSGLLSSPVWMQIMADALGRPVTASAEPEATSRGVALLALQALGFAQQRPAALGATYHPRDGYTTQYQAALSQHVHLYDKLVEISCTHFPPLPYA